MTGNINCESPLRISGLQSEQKLLATCAWFYDVVSEIDTLYQCNVRTQKNILIEWFCCSTASLNHNPPLLSFPLQWWGVLIWVSPPMGASSTTVTLGLGQWLPTPVAKATGWWELTQEAVKPMEPGQHPPHPVAVSHNCIYWRHRPTYYYDVNFCSIWILHLAPN